MKKLFWKLVSKRYKKSVSDIETSWSQIQLPTISNESYAKCEDDITEDNLFVTLKIISKILSKAFAAKPKRTLPSIISSNQTAYVERRCISESGRLISDIIEIYGKENIPGFLVTMDLEKVFDSLDNGFVLCVLKKFGFGDNFITWIKILF